jgi:RimJ/RimL family protein N-acetyltransferase
MPSPSPTATLPTRTITLRDGGRYVMRPLGPADAPEVSRFFNSLSPETVRARYGYLIQDMTPERAHRLVRFDLAREMPIGLFGRGAAGRETLWGMARLVLAPEGGEAECAFLIHDAKRGLGMASRLLLYLRILARWRGVTRLFAQVHRENTAMLGVFRRAGATLHFGEGEVVEVEIPFRRADKNLFDIPRGAPSFRLMAQPEKKPFSPVVLMIDLVLCAAVFLFFKSLIVPHVPSSDPKMITLWSALASSCMTGVFWLALQMVKVVYRFQVSSRK